MRLDTLTAESWAIQSPYVDTLVLPVTPLIFKEKKIEIDAYKAVTHMALTIEKMLMGRVLLLPMVCCVDISHLKSMIQSLSASGFQHVFLLLHSMHQDLGEAMSGIGGVYTYYIADSSSETVEASSKEIAEEIFCVWENGI